MIVRLLDGGPQVLSTGGGAFMNADTRAAIAANGISIWLNADFDVLMKRIRRRHDRPLLKTDDPAATLRNLMQERYPTYALADLTVQSHDVAHDKIVDDIVAALAAGSKAQTLAPIRASEEIMAHECAPMRAERAHCRQCCARRAQLFDRDRPRSDRLARAKNCRRCGRAPRLRSSLMIGRRLPSGGDAKLRLRTRELTRHAMSVPPGESSKSFPVLERVCEALIASRIERGDLVVALGGGVIGDLAGFAAADRAPRP